MQRYRTRDGDMLDEICQRHYGRTAGTVEAVLEANRGLAALGPVYAAGVVIALPELPAKSSKETIRLWD
ncbi:tail protein X [Geoalkalibacter halelectricus]|uniref:tail protein X n=1 Tax=Geoalkalibacter halelectricus TaxID=2847045 RepID=UPI003D1AAAF2